MEFIVPRNFFLKLAFVFGLIFLLYGYLCRLIGIYFFWESKSIGWFLMLLALMGLIRKRIRKKRKENPNYRAFAEKLGVSVIVFSLLLKIAVFFLVSSSAVFADAKNFLLADSVTTAELGPIKSFSVVPWGGMARPIDSTGTHATTTIILIVKGEKKYKQLTLSLYKLPEEEVWKVLSIQGLDDQN
jgi:hypothetical protein